MYNKSKFKIQIDTINVPYYSGCISSIPSSPPQYTHNYIGQRIDNQIDTSMRLITKWKFEFLLHLQPKQAKVHLHEQRTGVDHLPQRGHHPTTILEHNKWKIIVG